MPIMEKDKQEDNGCFNIHNVEFYNPAPRQIKCLSFNKKTYRLAVSRDDHSIEIWDMRSAVFMEKCILGQSSSSVEGLRWLNDRLFSTGLTGELIEWNLVELKPKQKVSLTGNAALCMDIDESNSCIAVGTQEGYMNVFSVNGSDLNFTRLFDKQEGAIFCCRFDSTGRYIVTGSTDTIRIWNVDDGHAMYKMTTGRSAKNKETNVWSLVVLKDLTIIAGDSRGFVTVWNGLNGTRIDAIDVMNADVLAVAVSDDEETFCCAGVDPNMMFYSAAYKDNQRKWIRNFKKSVHDHDVKAMSFIDEDKILSGGIDGYIKVSSCKKVNTKHLNDCKFGPFLPQPCAVVAMPSRLLLLKYFNYLEVWRLGRPNDDKQLTDEQNGQRKFLSMDESQVRLIDFKSKHTESITCASISPDGNFLIYSTESYIGLFQLNTKTMSQTKVKVDSDKFTACTKVFFSSDSKTVYCVKSNGDIAAFLLSWNDEVDIKATISTNEVLKDTISLVCLSKSEEYLVCADASGTLAVWKNKNNRWKHSLTWHNEHCAPTAMAIHQKSGRIVVAFSDYKVIEFDVTNGIVCATAFDWLSNLQKKFVNTTHTAIKNIILDENNENVVVLHNDSVLFVLEKGEALHAEGKSMKKRKSEPSNSGSSEQYQLKTVIENYEHFVHLAWLSPKEIVAIKVNHVAMIAQLPPSMKRKLYGIS